MPAKRQQPEFELQCVVVALLRFTAMPGDEEALERVLSRVVARPSGCLEWTGAANEKGYGRFRNPRTGKSTYVHRFIAEQAGFNPGERLVCHHCDNPRCCRPEHLFVGTHADNVHDAMAKGRAKPPPTGDGRKRRDEGRHHWQKINGQQAAAIKARLALGERHASIAADFGLSFQAISKIKLGQRWA